MATLTVVFALSLQMREANQQRLLLHQTAREAAEDLHDSAESEIRAIEHMALHWSSPAAHNYDWKSDARANLRDFQGLQALFRVDEKGALREYVARPEPGYDPHRILKALMTAVARSAERPEAVTGLASLPSSTDTDGESRKVMAVWVPLRSEEGQRGALVGQIGLQELLSETVGDLPFWNVAVDVFQDGQLIAQNDVSSNELGIGRSAQFPVRIRELALLVSVRPAEDFLPGTQTALPEFALVSGLLVSFLLGISLFYALKIRGSSQSLDDANRALEVDIRARKRTEAELRELNESLERKVEERTGALQSLLRMMELSEHRFRDVVEAAPNALLMADRDGRIVLVNREVDELFGYTRAELIGREVSILLPERFRGRHGAQIAAYLAKPETRAMGAGRELFGLHKDGREIPVEIGLNPIETAEGTFALASIVDITERKRAEGQFRMIVESSPNALLVIDRDNRITLVSRNLELLFGYTCQELIGRPLDVLIPPRLRGNHGQFVRSYFEQPKIRRMGKVSGLAGLHKNGDEIPVEIGLSPVETTEGLFALATIVDIRERTEAERRLRESEARFRGLIEQTKLPILVHRDFKPLFANEAYAQLFGFGSREAAQAQPDLRATMLPEDRPERVETYRRQVIGAQFADPLTRRALGQDGREFWVQVIGSEIAWEGEPAIVVFYQDVTRRIQAQQELRESQRLLTTVFESLPLRLSVKDTQGRYLLVNRELARGDGLSPGWYPGKTIHDLTHPTQEQKDTVWRQDQDVLETGEVMHGESQITLADGKAHILDIVRFPMKDEAGHTTGLVVVGSDVTEQTALREQFHATQRLESVGRLAGGMAHDFNNILSVIMNYAQFLYEDYAGNEQAQADAKHIVNAAERGAALIRQLLAFSRKQVQRLDVLNLNEVVTSIESLLRRLIGEDITLNLRQAPQLGKVNADSSQLEQVLMNLVVNARDAMPEGGTLTIETANSQLDENSVKLRSGTDPGDYVLLAVSDTGIGMTEEVKRRIFEPFYTTKEVGKGTGLGLATVYGIVKQTGGHIWVYSEPGVGTTFKIYLPLAKEEQSVAAEPVPARALGGTETILLVEDEEMVRQAALRILASAGYRVMEASDGEKALQCANGDSGAIDLLLTDVVMPRMSGRQLSDRLRKERPGLRVLYMSGYTENAIVHHGVLEQNVLLVQKPFTRDSLLRMVRSALESQSA
jgi:PAS domain S-box-containing protein